MDSFNFCGYDVPLIPSGLRHEETIIQTANALEYLNNTINDIFDKIDNRVNKNNEKIEDIQERIKKANEKISKLVGTKKAICIYSPSKFPAVHILKDIPATFSEESYTNLSFKLNQDYEVESDLEPLTQTSLQDKLEFFHVRETPELSRISKILNTSNGLGSIPHGLKSVNSLLLYNTTQNVYVGEKEKGVFKGQTQFHTNEDKNEITKKKIEAPPISITNRQLGPEKKVHKKLFYTPKLNEAPDINLPLDLPDLPGIADNIQFGISKKEKVAPSLSVEVNKASVTNIESKEESILENESISENIPEAPVELPSTSTILAPISLTKPLLPPVPPPPPPPLPEAVGSEVNITKVLVKVPQIPDVRSNLMEAIRKAGGTRGGKLRAAADVVSDKAINSNKSFMQTSNNLMDDLHKKLLMRRKGISGSKDSDKSGSVLNRLSSLIPPPPKPSQGMYSSTSDNDIDDEWD